MLIKVSFRGQVRRFEAKFPRNKNQETEEEYLNFQWLADKLSQLFQNEETLQEKVSILYLDEQDDWILLSSDEELETAMELLHLQKQQVLCLKLVEKDNKEEVNIVEAEEKVVVEKEEEEEEGQVEVAVESSFLDFKDNNNNHNIQTFPVSPDRIAYILNEFHYRRLIAQTAVSHSLARFAYITAAHTPIDFEFIRNELQYCRVIAQTAFEATLRSFSSKTTTATNSCSPSSSSEEREEEESVRSEFLKNFEQAFNSNQQSSSSASSSSGSSSSSSDSSTNMHDFLSRLSRDVSQTFHSMRSHYDTHSRPQIERVFQTSLDIAAEIVTSVGRIITDVGEAMAVNVEDPFSGLNARHEEDDEAEEEEEVNENQREQRHHRNNNGGDRFDLGHVFGTIDSFLSNIGDHIQRAVVKYDLQHPRQSTSAYSYTLGAFPSTSSSSSSTFTSTSFAVHPPPRQSSLSPPRTSSLQDPPPTSSSSSSTTTPTAPPATVNCDSPYAPKIAENDVESEVSRSVAATDPDQLPLLNEIAANTTSITTTFQDPSPITYASTATSGSLHGSELFVDAPAISSSSFFLQQQQQQELFAEAFINEQDRGDEEQHRELVVEDKEEVVSVEGVAERQHVEEEVVEEVSLTPITSSASSIVPDDTEEEEEKEEKEKTDEVKVEEEDESIELDRNSNNSGNFDEDEDLCVVMTSSIAIEMEDDTTSASSSSNTATRIPDSPPSIDHFEDEFVFL